MIPPIPAIDHIADGDLIRLLDHEAGADEDARYNAHIDMCEQCRLRLRMLERRSLRLGELLAATDWSAAGDLDLSAPPALAASGLAGSTVPEPARSLALPKAPAPGGGWLRYAALLAGLITAGALASPAGASLTGWITTQWQALVEAWTAPTSPAASAPPHDPFGTRVRFTAPVELMIEFASNQASGGLLLERGEGTEIVVEVMRGRGAAGDADRAELMVLPGGVRVRNHPGTTADYRVLLPPQSRLVRIRIGGAPPIELQVAELAAERWLELRER
jgi:hypothetical protein